MTKNDELRAATPAPMCHARRDAAPAGWKLVPLEPTPEMQQAGFETPGAHGYNASYRAMVAAAPVAVAPSDAKGKADRIAFEAWVKQGGGEIHLECTAEGVYVNLTIENEWQAWQAALEATGKADAANAGEVAKLLDTVEMMAKVHECGVTMNVLDKLRVALRQSPATSAADAKDAERWRETLKHVGAAPDPQRFVFRWLSAVKGADIMNGSVAQHFTEAIDAASQQGKE